MDLNEQAVQWLQKHSKLSPQIIQRALERTRQSKVALGDFLFSHRLLSKDDHDRLAEALQANNNREHKPRSILQGYEGIERYSVLEEIGSGGMGRVFRARVNETGIPVVIKTLLSMRSTGRQLERFHREGMALARLSHPNIARVYDFRLSNQKETDNQHPYLVMEHIEGLTLSEFFECHRADGEVILDEELLQQVFIPLAKALIHCHDSGVIHRDVKPENVLVEVGDEGSKPRPVLVDFGLVRVDKEALRESLELSQQLTQSGQLIGSPAFAAPEQLNGDVEKFGAAMDVWGFGATLYWAVSNKLPYDVQGLVNLLQASEKNPRSLRSHHSQIPQWLDSLCALCLQSDPKNRPTMTQVLERLESKRSPRPRISLKIMTASAFILLALSTLVILLFRDQNPPQLSIKNDLQPVRTAFYKLKGSVIDDHPKKLWIQKRVGQRLLNPRSYPLRDAGAFEIALSLVDGPNEFLIWGEDQSGLKSSPQTITIAKDSLAPKLTMADYPKSTYAETITLSGQVSERATLQIGSESHIARQSRFELSTSLKPGSNEIRIAAVDLAGNRTTELVTIFRREAYHVVPGDTKNKHRNGFEGLANAIRKIPPRSRLYLYPGVYSGDLDIDKTLELIGVGDRRKILISSSGRPLRLTAPKIHLKNLHLEATGSRGNGTVVDIQNDDCIIEHCILRSEYARGVSIGDNRDSLDSEPRKLKTRGSRIIDCQFLNCRAYGLVVHSNSKASISKCIFKGNGAGANILNGSAVRFQECQFIENGRGINAGYGASIEINKCIFKDNHGTAINLTNRATGSVSKSTVTGSLKDRNTSSFPTVKARDNARLTMHDCVIQRSCGAGVHAETKSEISLVNCRLLNNKEAGVRALRGSLITLSHCQFNGNKSPKRIGSNGKIVEK